MSPFALRVASLAAWSPLAVSAVVALAASRGWQVRDGDAANVAAFREIAFQRRGLDWRVSVGRFEPDSCPWVDEAGDIRWDGTWTPIADFSLWPLFVLSVMPPLLTLRRRAGRRLGFPVGFADQPAA